MRYLKGFLPIVIIIFLFSFQMGYAQEVSYIVYNNPIAGFGITIPEDWEMSTGTAGQTEIAIDASAGASLLYFPLLWFFYVEQSPEYYAKILSTALQYAGGKSIDAHPTGRENEWEVIAYMNHALLGEMRSQWMIRSEGKVNYVIAGMVRFTYYETFKKDLDLAFRTFHLIERPTISSFLEPTENAYRIFLPYGWKWEGEIIRGTNLPGFFVWKAQSSDELSGCFTSLPVPFDPIYPYTASDKICSTLVLQELKKKVPDLCLEKIHSLPRAAEYYVYSIKALVPSVNPRIDKIYADYVGNLKGVPIRIRTCILTYLIDSSPLFGGNGYWQLMVSGAWAPIKDFDNLYSITRGVQTSLSVTREWKKQQEIYVKDVLGYKSSVFEETNTEWDRYIRQVESISDPDGGPTQEVPYGPGIIMKDLDGKMYRIPSEQVTQYSGYGWKEVKTP